MEDTPEKDEAENGAPNNGAGDETADEKPAKPVEKVSKTLGARLAEQRELRKVSLDEIARVTKISIHILHAMEKDKWDALPGGIFTRNFIRLYANHLGLDAERWVEEWMQLSKERSEAAEESELLKDGGDQEMSQSWLLLLLVVIVILLIGGYFAITKISESPAEPVATQQTPMEPAATSREPVQETVAAPQDQGLRLELTETADRVFWYKWWADGALQNGAEGTSTPKGEKVVLGARERITMLINHYQSVEITLNGKPINWEDLTPVPKTNDEGAVTSYEVEVTSDLLR